MTWYKVAELTAPEGQTVMTKIEDENGVSNEQALVREDNLWFIPDKSMYVYYTPTHWKIEGGAVARLAVLSGREAV